MNDRNKKYNPRRLFSIDSLKTSRTASSDSNDNTQYVPEGRVTLPQVDEMWHDDPFGDDVRIGREFILNDTGDPVRRSEHVKGPTGTAERPSTPDSTSSTASISHARWDKIRQHVLPSSSSLTRQLAPPRPAVVAPLLAPIPRSTTPKPSRLARLGFRQVVEQVKDTVDETDTFASEIRKACWLSRYGDQTKSKHERDNTTATMGSTLYLPFMTNPSLSGPSIIPSTVARKQESSGSQLSQPSLSFSSSQGGGSIPTLKPLWKLLMKYATPAADGLLLCHTLPHETLVLSVLQGPFLKPGHQGWMQEERRIAMESFELIFKSWFPENESSFLNYCQWCCIAATMPPGHLRLRSLNAIHGLLGSRNVKLIWTPAAFRSIFAELLNLLALSSINPIYFPDTDGMNTIQSCLSLLRSGACVAFDPEALVERYQLTYSKGDDSTIRDLIAVESLARCIESFKGPNRAWFIQYACNDGWLPMQQEWLPSSWKTKLHTEKLITLSRALCGIFSLSEAGDGVSHVEMQLSLQLLQTRILPEVDAIETKATTNIKQYIAKIALRILILDSFTARIRWATSAIQEWCDVAGWKHAFESALHDLTSSEGWPAILRTLDAILRLTQEPARQVICAHVVPLLNQRLVEDPPPFPSPVFSSILGQLSQRYPAIFYKCLFSCAASSKDYAIIHHLCMLTAINKFIPDFWIRDPDMISIALINDPNKKVGEQPGKFKPARLGQLIVLVELIGQMQVARHRKEEISQTDSAFLEIIKFAMSLESRLAILLDAREKDAPYPFSHRVLYCILLRELRLLTRSSKPAPWLPKVVTWFVNYHDEEWMSDADYEESEDTLIRLQALYEAARNGVHSTRKRSTVVSSMPSPLPDMAEEKQNCGIYNALGQILHILNSARKGFSAKAMKLLVLMSTLISPEDYERIGPVIWTNSLNENVPSTLNSACYLAMQCAEKTPQDFLAMIEVDVKSSDDLTRLHALQKVSTLCNQRYELATQQAISDRQHRPFKLARGPLPFVPTDMGSSSYISDDDPEQGQNSVPIELKKQLAEIGWTQEDSSTDSRQAWSEVPMLLLPTQDLSRLESIRQVYTSSPSLGSQGSPSLSNDGTAEQLLLRRNSSSGGPSYSVKRRSVFVPPLTLVFLRVAALLFDPNIVIASAAKTLVLDLLRNDPSLLTRPIFDLLSEDDKDISLAMSKLDLFLHAHWAIPPSAAHYVFNHLAGYLKSITREKIRHNLVDDFARIISPLVDLVPHVSGMSLRELRRSKIELCFIPTGSLWFPRPSPNERMFPTELVALRNPTESLPPSLISMTMIRVCQNLMFASMLRKNRQDVQFIRKRMSRLELPSLDDDHNPLDLELGDLFAKENKTRTAVNGTLLAFSLTLSRSYLLLVSQVFHSLPRHLSDRNELEVLTGGLTRILLTHGDDIGIVSQTLITLMVACTRFRRLFMSGGAYILFMPALLKVYADSDHHSGIRLAIEYAVGRFYALHQEAFVFQSLDVFSRLAALREPDGEKLGKSVFDLFASLRRGTSSSAPDAAGIHDANKGQEREALLLNAADEKPQVLLASMKHGPSDTKRATLDLLEEYPGAHLRISDFVRLYLTIIAHDASSLRAENFLKLFCLVVPFTYQTSIASRPILQEGIEALGLIFMKQPTKGKAAHPEPENLSLLGEGTESQSQEAAKSGSDYITMRLDYLALISSFTRAGGTVTQPTIRRAMDMVRSLLKDEAPSNKISAFLSDLTEAFLLRENTAGVKEVVAYLQHLTPIIGAFSLTLDFGRIFTAITKLVSMSMYATELTFSRTLGQVCEASLAACALADRDKLILSLPHRSNLVILLSQVTMSGSNIDITSELEKHPPTYDYLAGIVLPIVMTLRTETAVSPTSAEPRSGQGSRFINLWVRLLQYALTVCQTVQRSLDSDSRKSIDKRRSVDSSRTTSAAQISTFLIGLQILKAILIKAGDELSPHLPALWHRLASFFKTMLMDGNADFTLQPLEPSRPASPVTSRVTSPTISSQVGPSTLTPSRMSELHTSGFQPTYLHPRIVDYAMWSLFELLCSYRTPLLLEMRLFIVEKTADLDQALESQQLIYSPSSPAFVGSASRPISFSAFSKPFRRTSGSPSPINSPRFHQQRQESPRSSVYLTVSGGRKPGYQYQSPATSSPVGAQNLRGGPRIVHLGPVSASLLRPTISGSGTDSISFVTKSAKVKSSSLIRATYRRIRVVQTFMGYRNILPLPLHEGMDIDAEEVALSSWTKYQALGAIEKETDALMEEFDDSHSMHGETVLVEPEHYMLDTKNVM